MSTTDSRETLVRAGSPFFALAALFTLAIAGLSPALAHSADSTSAQQGASAPAARPNTAAEPTAPKGREEGIQVHGHWTIKVSNPDGKVVQHVEFENSLSPGLGGLLLMSLLTGTITPGSWAVGLETPNNGATACTNPITYIIATGPTYQNVCTLATPTGVYYQTCDDQEGCFPTLTITGPTVSAPTITLVGQMTAENSAPITGVVSMLNPCQPSVTPTACPTTTPYPSTGNTVTTAPPVIQQATGGNYPNVQIADLMWGIPLTGTSFGTAGSCGGTSQPPCQISVTAGQLVSASVTISFQ
jgi:hypothetical protein